jgi:uncharacterized protein (DUF58 family)
MRPTSRCIILLVTGVPAALLPVLLSTRLWVAWAAYATAALFLIGSDMILAGPGRHPVLELALPPTLYIGGTAQLRITVAVPGWPSPAFAGITCDVHEPLRPVSELRVPLKSGSGVGVFALTAARRGTGRIAAVWVRWSGPLGLIRRQLRLSRRDELPVVPDVRTVRRTALRFFGSRDPLTGEKMERYSGDGSEFEQLREFVPGLDHRAIDWKVSARHKKLFCREFRAERNHQVMIACDTGHLMSEPVDGIPKLDHAINAGLLLTWFSLRAGDRVGLFGFDKGINLYFAPQGGMGAFQRLQLATAGLEYGTEETNFTLGLAELSRRLRRRSLVILMTDFVDTVTAELMVDNLERLSRHHLVLFVTLRNPEIAGLTTAPPRSLDDVARSVVAAELLRERRTGLRRLERLGIQTVDADPEGISPELLNRYLDIKRREQIA